MQLEHNGQKEEAYSLTIYKTHAKAIASGEKTVEIRSYSNQELLQQELRDVSRPEET